MLPSTILPNHHWFSPDMKTEMLKMITLANILIVLLFLLNINASQGEFIAKVWGQHFLPGP